MRLAGYEQVIIPGAGLSVGPGAKKFVAHTTETGPRSLAPLIEHWRRNWGAGLPHFVQEGRRVVQLLPLDVGAYTLENAPGGADTNRSGPAVQVEVVSYAAQDWDDDTYETFGKLIADVKRVHDFDLGNHPRWYGANEGIVLASYNSPIRMTAAQYNAFNGWCAHQHVPENAHWDCGKKDTDRIERIARAHYAGSGVTPEPEDDLPYTEDQLRTIIRSELVANDSNAHENNPVSNAQLHGDALGIAAMLGNPTGGTVGDAAAIAAAIKALPGEVVAAIKAAL